MAQLPNTPLPKTEPPPAPKLPSKDELLKVLDNKAEQAKKTLAGKNGVNPFIWANETVKPLVEKIKNSASITSELVDEVNALELPKETVVEIKEVQPKLVSVRV